MTCHVIGESRIPLAFWKVSTIVHTGASRSAAPACSCCAGEVAELAACRCMLPPSLRAAPCDALGTGELGGTGVATRAARQRRSGSKKLTGVERGTRRSVTRAAT